MNSIDPNNLSCLGILISKVAIIKQYSNNIINCISDYKSITNQNVNKSSLIFSN